MRIWVAGLVMVAIFGLGCSKTGPEPTQNAPIPGIKPGSPPLSTAARPEDENQLKIYEEEYTKAKAAYSKQPTSKLAKETYVIATARLGTATMRADWLGPRVQYPRALGYYREALKVDPDNIEAKDNKALIEGIYKQMDRPIPQ